MIINTFDQSIESMDYIADFYDLIIPVGLTILFMDWKLIAIISISLNSIALYKLFKPLLNPSKRIL